MPRIDPDADFFGRERKSFTYASQGRPERRQVVPRPDRFRTSAVEQIAGKAAETSGVTPSQWLRLWCSLDEQT